MLLSEQAEQSARRAELPRWVVVAAGGLLCAIPARRSLEIAELPSLTRIPGTGREVRGLLNLRGRPVTVLDLAATLKASPEGDEADDGPARQVVVVECAGRWVGLAVDRVVDVTPVSVEPDDTMVLEGVRAEMIAGVGEHGGGVLLGLDTDEIVRSAFD
jgi:chemotaxis signal transduction protein